MWREVASNCRSCEQCQRTSKRKLIPALIVERKVVTQPFERVCVYIVGSLPKAKEGSKFLHTYKDVGSRKPETMPLRTAITQTVITGLNTIFSRNGYSRVMITDNGAQFTSKAVSEVI